MPNPRRYPLSALLEATGMSEHQLGQHVGLSGSSIKKARELGLVESAADKYACRAGLHPFEVWPAWFDEYQDPTAVPRPFRPRMRRHDAGLQGLTRERRMTVAAVRLRLQEDGAATELHQLERLSSDELGLLVERERADNAQADHALVAA